MRSSGCVAAPAGAQQCTFPLFFWTISDNVVSDAEMLKQGVILQACIIFQITFKAIVITMILFFSQLIDFFNVAVAQHDSVAAQTGVIAIVLHIH